MMPDMGCDLRTAREIWQSHETRRARRHLVKIAAFVAILAVGTIAFKQVRGEEVYPIPAQSNPRMPCHKATEIAKRLKQKYDETPIAFGLQSNGNLLQVYSSEVKNTWTVVSTTPVGISCIVAEGRFWEMLPAIPAGLRA